MAVSSKIMATGNPTRKLSSLGAAPVRGRGLRGEIGLQDLIASKVDEVWVLNTSDIGSRGRTPKGDINLMVRTGIAGDKVNIVIPNTFVPFNIGLRATKKDITNSPDFRKLILQNYIVLISPEEAKEILSDEDNRKEYDRVVARMNYINDRDSSFKFEDNTDGLVEGDDPTDHSEESAIHPSILEAFNDSEVDNSERYAIARNLERELSPNDWAFIATKTDYDKLKELARKNLKPD